MIFVRNIDWGVQSDPYTPNPSANCTKANWPDPPSGTGTRSEFPCDISNLAGVSYLKATITQTPGSCDNEWGEAVPPFTGWVPRGETYGEENPFAWRTSGEYILPFGRISYESGLIRIVYASRFFATYYAVRDMTNYVDPIYIPKILIGAISVDYYLSCTELCSTGLLLSNAALHFWYSDTTWDYIEPPYVDFVPTADLLYNGSNGNMSRDSGQWDPTKVNVCYEDINSFDMTLVDVPAPLVDCDISINVEAHG